MKPYHKPATNRMITSALKHLDGGEFIIERFLNETRKAYASHRIYITKGGMRGTKRNIVHATLYALLQRDYLVCIDHVCNSAGFQRIYVKKPP